MQSLFFVVLLGVNKATDSIQCTQQRSTVSSNASQIVSVECPAGLTMVSCGVEPYRMRLEWPKWQMDGIRNSGAWIQTDDDGVSKCYAKNTEVDPVRIVSVANCCDFGSNSSMTCQARNSGLLSGHGVGENLKCDHDEEMLGCSVYGDGDSFHGALMNQIESPHAADLEMQHISETQRGCDVMSNGKGVKDNAQCCKSDVALNCNLKRTEYSTGITANWWGDGHQPYYQSVGCDEGYDVMSCSGYADSGNIESWSISYGECVVSASDTQPFLAEALCCQIAPNKSTTTFSSIKAPLLSSNVHDTAHIVHHHHPEWHRVLALAMAPFMIILVCCLFVGFMFRRRRNGKNNEKMVHKQLEEEYEDAEDDDLEMSNGSSVVKLEVATDNESRHEIEERQSW